MDNEEEKKESESEEEIEVSDKQPESKFDWLKEYQWQKGQSGNPKGRPKEKTLKEWVRQFLKNMSEESRMQFLRGLNPDLIWRMGEGNPKETLEVEHEADPYANITDEQLKTEFEKRLSRMGQEGGKEKSNIPDGGDTRISKDGTDTSGSTAIPEQDKNGNEKGNNSASEEPLKNNNDNNQLDNTTAPEQSGSADIYN